MGFVQPVGFLKNWIPVRPASADGEAGLVTAARGGDRRAFDALAGAHQAQLRGFLARRVGPEAVDDILQETLLGCWTALPRFDGRSRFKTWLYGIALHKCADHLRAQKGRSATSSLEWADDTEAQRSVEDLYAAAELS